VAEVVVVGAEGGAAAHADMRVGRGQEERDG
jgi:hypothetical protein